MKTIKTHQYLSLFFFSLAFSSLSAQIVIPVTEIGELDDIISEPSGLAVIYNTSNGNFEYWAHNEYQYPEEIYSFRLNDLTNIRRTMDVDQSFTDWEDMAKDDDNNLYLADFGNWVDQNDLQFVKIPDPNTFAGGPPSVELIKYNYPTNGVRDSEAVVHLDGALYVFTKTVSSNVDPSLDENRTYCYKIPDSPLAGGARHTAVLHDSHQIIFPGDEPPPGDQSHFKVTAADISPDKKILVLMTYERIWVFSCFDGDNFFDGTVVSFEIPYWSYEGVTFINNHEIVISSEGKPDNAGYNPKVFHLDLYSWIDGSCIDCEKATNGNFDDTNLAWSLFLNGGAAATLDMSNGNAEIDIQTLGTSLSQINIRHKSLVLENGKTYRISYKAHAEDDRLVSVIAENNLGGIRYAYNRHQITTIPTYYNHEFTMTETTDYNSFLSLNVGNYIAHKVYFDDISIVEVDCTCPQDRYFISEIDNKVEHYETGNNIFGQNIINASNIKYDAANGVELRPGFEVKVGSVFEAYIDGCGGN